MEILELPLNFNINKLSLYNFLKHISFINVSGFGFWWTLKLFLEFSKSDAFVVADYFKLFNCSCQQDFNQVCFVLRDEVQL